MTGTTITNNLCTLGMMSGVFPKVAKEAHSCCNIQILKDCELHRDKKLCAIFAPFLPLFQLFLSGQKVTSWFWARCTFARADVYVTAGNGVAKNVVPRRSFGLLINDTKTNHGSCSGPRGSLTNGGAIRSACVMFGAREEELISLVEKRHFDYPCKSFTTINAAPIVRVGKNCEFILSPLLFSASWHSTGGQ